MIQINLLPVSDIKRRAKAKKEIFDAGYIWLLFLFVLFCVAGYLSYQLDLQKTTLEEKKAEKKEYDVRLAEIDKLEKEKEFEYIKHLDFKKGMKKKRFLECKEYKKFWKLKIEEFFKEELDKKLDDLDEESCVIEKVSENLLNSVNKRIETGKINIEYSSLSDYHKKRWQEIAEELICWFICETNPI